SAGGRCTGSWVGLPADRPARHFAAAPRYRSVVWPCAFPRRFLFIDVLEPQASWRSTLFFKTPIFSTSSSIVSCHVCYSLRTLFSKHRAPALDDKYLGAQIHRGIVERGRSRRRCGRSDAAFETNIVRAQPGRTRDRRH